MSINSSNPCSPVITFSHSIACPVFSVTSFSRYFLDNPLILSFIAISFGLIVTYQGRKFFAYTIFATGGLAGFGITMLLFSILSMISSVNVREELTWIGTVLTYTFSIAIGVFFGFILQKMQTVGAAILGAIGGIMLINLLFFWTQNDIILKSLNVIGALAMAFLSVKYYENIVIFGTSTFGGYCIVRGFSLFFKGTFPPETKIFELIIAGELSPEFFGYLAALGIFAVTGIYYQLKQRVLEQEDLVKKNNLN